VVTESTLPAADGGSDFSLGAGAGKLRVRVRPVAFDAGELAELLQRANRARQLDGLDDELNLDIVDSRKAQAFARGLARQSPEILAQLAGRELNLYWEDLGLSTAAPTHVHDFESPFALLIDEIQGPHVLARTTVSNDAVLAEAKSRAAEAALHSACAVVKKLESPKSAASGRELATARLRRSALARTWRLNAGAWAATAKPTRASRNALAAAEAAAAEYIMPRGGLTESADRQ
jgi:hypothetical protein